MFQVLCKEHNLEKEFSNDEHRNKTARTSRKTLYSAKLLDEAINEARRQRAERIRRNETRG